MKVKVPRIGMLVHYRGHAGDRFGDLHNAGEPILALVIDVLVQRRPYATIRAFPNNDTVPLRRDADIFLTPVEGDTHCVSPLPGTEDSWIEVEFEDLEEAPIPDAPPGEVTTAAAPATATFSGVIQKPPAKQPDNPESSSVDQVLGKVK